MLTSRHLYRRTTTIGYRHIVHSSIVVKSKLSLEEKKNPEKTGNISDIIMIHLLTPEVSNGICFSSILLLLLLLLFWILRMLRIYRDYWEILKTYKRHSMMSANERDLRQEPFLTRWFFSSNRPCNNNN